MPVKYTNKKGKEYYLHQGITKTGKPKYYFSPKREGNLATGIPEGFEVYENPNGQVFMRKAQPKIIEDEEVAIVEQELKKSSRYKYCLLDVNENAIVVYIHNQNLELMAEKMNLPPGWEIAVEKYLKQSSSYSPGWRFLLSDKGQRIFVAEKYCNGKLSDYWRQIEQPGSLRDLVRQVIKPIEDDFFF